MLGEGRIQILQSMVGIFLVVECGVQRSWRENGKCSPKRHLQFPFEERGTPFSLPHPSPFINLRVPSSAHKYLRIHSGLLALVLHVSTMSRFSCISATDVTLQTPTTQDQRQKLFDLDIWTDLLSSDYIYVNSASHHINSSTVSKLSASKYSHRTEV